jgi:putative acetyltransferase
MVLLRPERPADSTDVRELHRVAFGDDGAVVAALVDELRTLDGALSLVAEDAGAVVGSVLFVPGLLDAPRRLVPVYTLSPLAVLPARQRQGIGSALVRGGLQEMAERGVPVVFLEGDPAYYRRLGFVAGADVGFRRPSLRIPEPAFQAALLPAYEPWMTGTHVYAEAFWRHDAVGLRDPDA